MRVISAWLGYAVASKWNNGIPGNGRVRLNLLLSLLHCTEDDREPAALMGIKHVMGLAIVGVITTENQGEALVKTDNEVVAHGNRKANILAEGANCVHNPLVVCKYRGWDKGAIAILVGLTNMLKCHMWLVGIARANFMKDGSTDLRPSKLSDLALNFQANLECIGIC